jgi:uncharacterized membrane protein YhaH (DUF805 family)
MSQVHEGQGGIQFPGAFEETPAAQNAAASSFDVLPSFPQIFSFRGRIGRATFALIQLFSLVIAMAAIFAFEDLFTYGLQEILTIGTPLLHAHANRDVVGTVDQIGGQDPLRYGMLIILVPAWYLLGLSSSVRRLHDLDYSGWVLIPLNVAGAIPYIGGIAGLLQLAFFFARGTEGNNSYGRPPERAYLVARLRQLPRHIWRGETSLPNMVFVYVFFFNFILLDKVGATLTAGLGLSTINLLFVAALIILNCILTISVWRCSTNSSDNAPWHFFGRLVAVILAVRVAITLAGFVMADVA